MPPAPPIITPFVLGDYQTNCFVITAGAPDARTTPDQPCWIVDCGFEPRQMLDWIAHNRLNPQGIVLTHAHPDLMAGVDEALRRFGKLAMYIHEAERGFCSDPMLNLSGLLGLEITSTEPDHVLADGDRIDMAGVPWRVMHTPGHSPGGITLVHDQSKQALVGDTLFAGSIGRSDFPTSNPAQLARSLERLMELPDDVVVHPGHGPKTTIGQERRSNPFIRGGVTMGADWD
jgi:hydroxyacylglutathione hydrolase